MELLYKHEHLTCYNYDNSARPMIEVSDLDKGVESAVEICTNIVFFIMKGKVEFTLDEGDTSFETSEGQIFFTTIGKSCNLCVLEKARIVIFRIYNPIILCENFPIEKLYNMRELSVSGEYIPKNRGIKLLEINTRVKYFLEGMIACISDGLKCRCWFEMKIKEFFLLLRAYYPKESLHEFLFLILSKDAVFSEYIRLNWQRFNSIADMADSFFTTPKNFSLRFSSVFGKPPSRWIRENRAQKVKREIVSTKKSFKQIAVDNGFSSDALFTRFCRKELGETPTKIREYSDKSSMRLEFSQDKKK